MNPRAMGPKSVIVSAPMGLLLTNSNVHSAVAGVKIVLRPAARALKFVFIPVNGSSACLAKHVLTVCAVTKCVRFLAMPALYA